MGREKTTTQQTQRAEPTAEEQELIGLQLERARAAQPGQLQVQEQGLNLINQLLTGQDLPGFLQGLPGGISPDVTSRIVQQSLEDVRPGLQASGILDSGVRAELETETAADIRTKSEQFNIQNLSQLLNLAVGGQSMVQSPLLQQQGQLGGQLAGLRTTTGTSAQFGMNPFLKSFQQSLGQTLGAPKVSAGPFSFGG